MHIKKRGARALLYRTLWVAKGAEGNTHGFARQAYIGSLTFDATELLPELEAKLTPAERTCVAQRILEPARQALARARAEAEQRRLDPVWRLKECMSLLRDAAELSARSAVPGHLMDELARALQHVRRAAGSPAGGAGTANPANGGGHSDSLEQLLAALDSAARAVAAGHYGPAPAQGVRATRVYELWAAVVAHLDGANPDGLLRALQRTGWVKQRQQARRERRARAAVRADCCNAATG